STSPIASACSRRSSSWPSTTEPEATMALEFKLPDIGEGLTEGEVTKWLVKEGEAVGADQPMVEVLTDKATVEVTSPRAGTSQKILVPDGTKVPVGTV